MPVSVKNKEMLDSVESLRQFAALDLPMRFALDVVKALKRITSEIDSVNELQKKLVDKHCEKDDAGQPVHPLDANGKPDTNKVKLTDPEAYAKDVSELMDLECKFGFDALNLGGLGDKISVKPGVILALHWLFTE